jgi:hypothetical protein
MKRVSIHVHIPIVILKICVLFWIVFLLYHQSWLPRIVARHLYDLILRSLQGNMHTYTIRIIKALYQDGDLGIEN